MNRLKIVRVSTCLIRGFLSDGTPESRVVSDRLPDDAVLVAVHSDGRTVSLTYRSDSFEEVPDGEPVPLLTPMFQRVEAPR